VLWSLGHHRTTKTLPCSLVVALFGANRLGEHVRHLRRSDIRFRLQENSPLAAVAVVVVVVSSTKDFDFCSARRAVRSRSKESELDVCF